MPVSSNNKKIPQGVRKKFRLLFICQKIGMCVIKNVIARTSRDILALAEMQFMAL